MICERLRAGLNGWQKLLSKSGRDLIKPLKAWLGLSPFFSTGLNIVIETSRYTNHQNLRSLAAYHSRCMRDILWQVNRFALPEANELPTSIYLDLARFYNENLVSITMDM